MKICIVGGGNIGTAMAVEFAHNGHVVNMLTSRPEKWQKTIFNVDTEGKVIYSGNLNLITSEPTAAFDSVDYIFVTLPSNAQSDFSKKVEPFVKNGMKFFIMPGFGGSEFLLKPLIDRGAELFGFQRVHAIARIKEYGHSVWFDKKNSLHLAALHKTDKLNKIAQDIEHLFSMPCKCLKNYLCISLTPSNPILHTSRLYSMFRNFDKSWSNNELFYASWTDEASDVLIKMDAEHQQICQALTKVDLSSVRSLKMHYESSTIPAMTKKLRSIKSLSKILAPMKRTENGWIPDFDNRYFVCDFGYGLDILLQFSDIVNIYPPLMNAVMSWYRKVAGNYKRCIDLSNYGLQNIDDIYKYYT